MGRNASGFVRRARRLALPVAAVALGLGLNLSAGAALPVLAATLTVNSSADNTTDDAVLTLREALFLMANGSIDGRAPNATEAQQISGTPPGAAVADTVVFAADTTVTVDCTANSGALPALAGTAGDVVDGSGRVVVVLAGTGCEDSRGFQISGSNNQVKGIRVGQGSTKFANAVIFSAGASSNTLREGSGAPCALTGSKIAGVTLAGGDNNTVRGCLIGVDATGTTAVPNASGISVNSGVGHTIGGNDAEAANVIAGNTGAGIGFISGAATVSNNFIGTNPVFATNLGNGGHGINAGSPSAALTIISNTIGKNGQDGVRLAGAASGHSVGENRIGTNQAGTANLGNVQSGITVALDVAANVTIGSNTIKHNGAANFAGVAITSGGTVTLTDNTISNQVGNGIAANGGAEIKLGLPGDAASANRITSNGNVGLRVQGFTANVVVVRNVFDGNPGGAIFANNTGSITIGGAPGDGNTFNNHVVDIGVGRGDPTAATVSHNQVNSAGSPGNPSVGVDSTAQVVIGPANTISGGGAAGIKVADGSTSVRITQNSLSGNGGLGIDLGPNGVSCGAADGGVPAANGGILCPTVTAADASTDQVGGTFDLVTCPIATCAIEVYRATAAADDNGHGEGTTFLGTANLDPAGTWTFSSPVNLLGGDLLTATATNTAANRTSEFAQNRAAAVPQGAFKPDGIIGGDGNNAFGAQGSGAGGSAPPVPAPKKNKPPKIKPFKLKTKGKNSQLTVTLQICNDGSAPDTITTSWNEPGGIDVAIGGDTTSPRSDNVAAGQCVSQPVTLNGAAATKGSHNVIVDLQSGGDSTAFDSVIIRVKV